MIKYINLSIICFAILFLVSCESTNRSKVIPPTQITSFKVSSEEMSGPEEVEISWEIVNSEQCSLYRDYSGMGDITRIQLSDKCKASLKHTPIAEVEYSLEALSNTDEQEIIAEAKTVQLDFQLNVWGNSAVISSIPNGDVEFDFFAKVVTNTCTTQQVSQPFAILGDTSVGKEFSATDTLDYFTRYGTPFRDGDLYITLSQDNYSGGQHQSYFYLQQIDENTVDFVVYEKYYGCEFEYSGKGFRK